MTCRLCNQEKPLRESHIFPEWLYKPFYDESHKFFVLSTKSSNIRGTRRKGIYERLLCDDCENRFSVWEGYARNVFHDLPPNVIENSGRRIVLAGVKYDNFKLFQISLLWRASITTRREIHRIDLGPHTERIRRMLLEGRPGEPHEYGSILMLPPLDQELMQQVIYSPERVPNKLNGHTAYRAIFGGLFWVFIVSNHSVQIPQELFLSKDGRLSIFKVGEPAVKFIFQLFSEFFTAGMLKDPIQR